jgi:hypothetical protein
LIAASFLVLLVEVNTQPLPNISSTQLMHRDVDDWLAAQPERTVIIEYPWWYVRRGQTLYYTMAHKQSIVHGATSMIPREFKKRHAQLNRWPEEEALDLLSELNVTYVLVHVFKGEPFETEDLPQLVDNPRLSLVERFPTPIGDLRDIYLFQLLR